MITETDLSAGSFTVEPNKRREVIWLTGEHDKKPIRGEWGLAANDECEILLQIPNVQGDRSMLSPEEFMRESCPQECVLYYPGAGTDTQPFRLFGGNPHLSRVIYADYSPSAHHRQEVERLFKFRRPNARFVDLTPGDFGCQEWEEFWYGNSESREESTPAKAFGIRGELPLHPRVRFDYLATEAVGTYSVLLKAGIRPNFIVLQDHGFGGNWTTFGGRSQLYKLARQNNALPELLLVADNTDRWPQYEQVSEPVENCGAAKHTRALFRLFPS